MAPEAFGADGEKLKLKELLYSTRKGGTLPLTAALLP